MTAAVFAHPVLAQQAIPANSPVSAALMTAAVTVAKWEVRARTRRALRDLGPDHLYDIGLTTAEAMLEAEKPFWRA